MFETGDPASKVAVIKWVVIFSFSLLGAFMQREMTWMGRVMSFAIGILAAVVFAEPIRGAFSLDHTWGDAISAVLALTGRNWAAYVIKASKDPTAAAREILDIWRGKPKD